ncbi:MAG: asparaginase [Candidatus Riflebacteria bacterium]|nr:asparaginase [Candidatus Riflebacteria bacterium]
MLLIHTGGTIGSLPKYRDDPRSPLVPGRIDEILTALPSYDKRKRAVRIHRTWVPIDTVSWDEPLDSSNVTLDDWRRLAQVVAEHYDGHEGFVILHGTDTLAYSASALSFILRNLAKPVILTGSQRPIGEVRSDAVQNLVTSIELAAAATLGATVVPEVCIFFHDELLRGCRARKLDATGYRAFSSPKVPPLARAGEHIVVDRLLIVAPAHGPLEVAGKLEARRGVVLQTFGTGNAPSTPDFLDAIGSAIDRGITIVNVSQCPSGSVELGLYDVSSGLLARGVVSGLDMTPEAALTKMCVVLGGESDPRRAGDLMQLDLAGEQRQSIFTVHFPGGVARPAAPTCVAPVCPMTRGRKELDVARLDHAELRLVDPAAGDGANVPLEALAFLDQDEVRAADAVAENPHFLGRIARPAPPAVGPDCVLLDATEPVRRFVDGRRTNRLTIVSTGGVTLRWRRAELALFVNS